MAIKLKNITSEKHLDTNMDSLVFHFDDTKTESLVSEFEVPDNYRYMIFLSKKTNRDNEIPSWVEIINPEAITKDSPLPDIGMILYDGIEIEFRELIAALI